MNKEAIIEYHKIMNTFEIIIDAMKWIQYHHDNYDFDTIITIKPMLNQLQFHSLDSIKEAVCLAERDAHAYLTAIGVAPGQHIEVLHADTLYAEFSYKWRKEDTAHYDISNLIFGDFTARIINSCKDTVLYDFMVGGTKPYIVSVDSSKSELKVKCPSDTTGIISALFSGGADSCFCYLQRLNSDGRYKIIQSGVVFSHEAVQEVKYTGLGKGNYMLVMTSTIPGCNDIGIFNIEITGPADVVGRHQILDISCNAFTDGSVTFKPHRRGTSAPVNYVIHRDSALIEEDYDAYMLYKKEETKVAKTKFKDESKMSKWAVDSIKKVSDAGIMNGDTDGNFRPKDNLTREEAAVIVANLLEKLS